MLVRVLQPHRELVDDVEALGERRRRIGRQAPRQGRTAQELHREERRLVVGADVMDRDDVAVAHPRDGAGLAQEVAAARDVERDVRQHDLDRHRPVA